MNTCPVSERCLFVSKNFSVTAAGAGEVETVDRALSQCGRDLAVLHRRRIRAHRVHDGDMDRVVECTDLEPGQIFGLRDRALVVEDVAETGGGERESLELPALE